MYLLREETGASLPQIGALLGAGTTPQCSTAAFAAPRLRRIADLIEEDAEMRREVVSLRQRLHAAAC